MDCGYSLKVINRMRDFIHNIIRCFGIFRIRREERLTAIVILIYSLLLNGMVVYKYFTLFSSETRNYFRQFVRNFHISGFDPITYVVLSDWFPRYNIYRHPLLAFFIWPFSCLDKLLMWLTGHNCSLFIAAAILVFCAVYSAVFLYRIFREVICVRHFDACMLTFLTFTFGYVMVSISVPDHFSMSMFMLILVLYISGKHIKEHRILGTVQTVVLFFLTAGISLNNGIKVFLSNLFVNGKRFWNIRNLLLGIIIPAGVIWWSANAVYAYYEQPRQIKNIKLRARVVAKRHDKIAKAFKDTTTLRDTAAVNAAIAKLNAANDSAIAKKKSKRAVFSHAGKAMGKKGFLKWTDITTPRWASIVENLFGESIQLHRDYLLGDTLIRRPVIVHYRMAFNYVVEGIIVLCFLCGFWLARRSRFAWLAMSFFLFDMVIHLVLGFGLNEVYIMSPHWMFVFTIMMAWLLLKAYNKKWLLWLVRTTLMVTGLYLLLWNGILYGSCLLGA